MIGRKSSFSSEQKTLIKKMIWDGVVQRVVAERFGLSKQSVHSIVGGYMWPGTLWPDGLPGPLSDIQRREIARKRWDESGHKRKTRHHKIAEEMREEDSKYQVEQALARASLHDDGIEWEAMTEDQVQDRIYLLRARARQEAGNESNT